jgi:hypothetical protein
MRHEQEEAERRAARQEREEAAREERRAARAIPAKVETRVEREKIVERQILVVRCNYCQKLTPADLSECRECGARQ